MERRRKGETVKPEDYYEKYPELADQLQDLLPTLAVLEEANVDPAESQDSTQPERLGEYKLLRTVGKGGMGVVYEAVQEALDRRVALKILPHAVSQNEKLIERFRLEARSAASLHHTNIVPVFDVGHEGDTFFYAMQFIDGRGLDQVISDLKQLVAEGRDLSGSSLSSVGKEVSGNSSRRTFYKSIAKLGADVADALQYAHNREIQHRDVKPSNLLLDNAGVVWLADFGLAKTSDVELTETGDFIGTARYMAPERLKGQGDARADIYGLGVTLYELLTLKKAFGNDDRLQLIDNIANQEARRPRDIQSSIPLDLETIVIKAMEKEPRKRYQSAQELADDLRRFVDDQQIQARRATKIEQLGRWIRRNKALTTGICSMAATIVVLIVSAFLISQQRDLANANFKEAEKQRKAVDAQREIAEENFQLALDSVNTYFTTVSQETLLNEPGMEPLRGTLLQLAKDFYADFASRRENDTSVRAAYVDAIYRLGVIELAIASQPTAVELFRDAEAKIKSVAGYESQPDLMQVLLSCNIALASALKDAGELEASEVQVLEGISNAEKLVELRPRELEPRIRQCTINGKLVAILAPRGGLEESLVQAKMARDLLLAADIEHHTNFEFHIEYGLASRLIGAVQSGFGNYPDAVNSFLESKNAFEKALAIRESSAQTSWYLANQLVNLSLMENRVGRASEAIEHAENAVSVMRNLVNSFPLSNRYRDELAGAYASLGNANWAEQDFSKALESYQLGLEQRQAVVDARPENVEYLARLARLYQNIALTNKRLGKPENVVQDYRDSIRILEVVTKKEPSTLKYWSDLNRIRSQLAGILANRNQFEEAESLLKKAYDESLIKYEEFPGVVDVASAVIDAANPLSNLYHQLDDRQQALETLAEGIRVAEEMLETASGNQSLLRQLAVSYLRKGQIQFEKGDYDGAQASLQTSEKVAPDAERKAIAKLRESQLKAVRGSYEKAEQAIQSVAPELTEEMRSVRFELARTWASIYTGIAATEQEYSLNANDVLAKSVSHLARLTESEYWESAAFLQLIPKEPVFRAMAEEEPFKEWLQTSLEALESTSEL